MHSKIRFSLSFMTLVLVAPGCTGQVDSSQGEGHSVAGLTSPNSGAIGVRALDGTYLDSTGAKSPDGYGIAAGDAVFTSGGWWHLMLNDLSGHGDGSVYDGDQFTLQECNYYDCSFYYSAICGGGSDPGCGSVEVNRTVPLGWETFTAHKIGPGTYGDNRIWQGDTFAISSANGSYCTAEGGGSQAFTCNRAAIGGWETFTMEQWQ